MCEIYMQHVCACVCVYASMYVCGHACMHTYEVPTDTHTHTCTHKYIDIYIYTSTHRHTSYMQTFNHPDTHTQRHYANFSKKKQVLLGIQRGTLIFGTSHLYPQGIQSLCRRGCCKLPYLWLRGPRRTSLWQSW